MDRDNIERDIKRYQAEVDLMNSLERLEGNSDFQSVIGNGYLKAHLLNLVSQRAKDPTPDNEVSRNIDAVSALMLFLDNLKTNGATAKASLADAEQTLADSYIEE